jgi:hypothetical protein
MVKRLLIYAVIVLVVTLSAHAYGFFNSFYMQFWWYDISMHFFGGVGVGFLGLWLFTRIGFLPTDGSNTQLAQGMRKSFPEGVPRWLSLICALLAVAIVSPYWEQLETFVLAYLSQPIPVGYIMDTTIDYTMAFIGGIVSWYAVFGVQYKV